VQDLLDNLMAATDDAGAGMSDASLRDELMTLLVAGQVGFFPDRALEGRDSGLRLFRAVQPSSSALPFECVWTVVEGVHLKSSLTVKH